MASSLETFVTDDALEGGAVGERLLFDNFEPFGESDTREGDALSKCVSSYLHNVDVPTEYYTHEVMSATERRLRNALKFGTSGEVNSAEGLEFAQGARAQQTF